MASPDDDLPLPPQVLFLKRLVLAMAVVMIAGFVALIATLIVQLSTRPQVLPASVTLPDGASALAYTQGNGWFAIVTDDNRILIFDSQTGALRQSVAVGN